VNRVENILDENCRVFFQKIRYLGLAQGSDGICIAIMAQKRKDIVCKDIGICVRAITDGPSVTELLEV
jgi:hypothetical protein